MTRTTFQPFIDPEDIPSIRDEIFRSDFLIGECPICTRELIPEATCLEMSRSKRGNRQFQCMWCSSLLEATTTPDISPPSPLWAWLCKHIYGKTKPLEGK